ncbi:MAG: HAMP domain-containing sensor histidine kinase [Bacillota bacterium]|nr:HAMP domain-containing sensor histidine kinase [Bacillota bacterium]
METFSKGLEKLLNSYYSESETPIFLADRSMNVIWNNKSISLSVPQYAATKDLKLIFGEINWSAVLKNLEQGKPIAITGKIPTGECFTIHLLPLTPLDILEGVLGFLTKYDKNGADAAAGMLAHDIKNKVSIIKNVGQLLKSSDAIMGRDRTYLDVICRNSAILFNLARNFDIIKDEISYTHLLKTELLDYVGFIKSLYSEARLYAQKSVDITFDCDETCLLISCDPVKIEDAVVNLFINALKYCRSAVKIKLFKRNNMAVLTVYNNGSGIPEENMSNIFLPFFTTDKKEGKGLGLYITKLMAVAHKGNLYCENTNDGVEFTFELPLVQNISELRSNLTIYKPDNDYLNQRFRLAIEERNIQKHS